MEVLVTLTLLGVGYYFNKKENSSEINKNRLKRNDINTKKKLRIKNIYESNQLNLNKEDEKKLVRKNSLSSKYPQRTNVIPRNYNSLYQSEPYNYVNSGNSLIQNEINNKIKKSNDIVYLERPSHTRKQNQRESDDSLNQENFISSLSGETMTKDSFKHNNMVPFFGGRIKQNVDEFKNSSLLEHHTGISEHFETKKEISPLFNPQSNLNHVHGTPNMDTSMLDRYIPSRFRDNEAPIEKINVGPGLNKGYTSSPSGGFNQSDTRQYVMPKTTNQLRTANNPKLSYKGVVVPGKGIDKPSKMGKMNKNNPDRYYINSPGRYNVTTGAVIKEKKRPTHILKCTDRPSTHSAYSGSAGPASVKGPYQKSLFRDSTKTVYKTSSIRNMNMGGQWNQANDDYGKEATYIGPTERDITQDRTHVSNISTYVKAIVAPLQDLVKTTRKENFIGNNRQTGNFSSQMPSKQTIYDPNDVARTTIKETNIHDNRTGNMKGPTKVIVYDPDNIARTTIKETNIHDNRTGNMSSGVHQLPAYDPNDIARTTIKETNIHDNRTGNINRGIHQLPAYDPNDVTRTTIKETNIHDNRSGNINRDVHRLPVYDPNDVTRTTIKETNIHDNRTGNINRGVNQLPAYDPNDITRTTIKETNIHDNRTGNINRGVNQLPAYDPNDITRTTIKETNIHDNRTGNINRGVTQLPAYDPNDITRTTIKETNIHDNRTGNINSGVNQLPAYDPNDISRTTIKETNIHDNRTGNINRGVTQLPAYDPNDITRTTIKETNIHDNRTGNINRGVTKLPAYDPNDITRTTVKETNIHDNRTGNIGIMYSGEAGGSKVSGRTRDPNDVAKVTIRETMENQDTTLNLGPQGPSKITVYDPEDIAKTTIKETNIHDNRTGNVTGTDGANYGYLTNDIQVPNTNKQFTSDNDYVGQPDGNTNNGGGEGYLTNDIQVPNTNKQFTSDNEYTGDAQGSAMPVSYDDAYNATYSGDKEMVSEGRIPTQSSTKIAAGEDTINMEIKKIESDYLNTRDLASTKVYNSLPQPEQCQVTTDKQQVSNDMNTERIEPNILEAFKNNPYTQPLDSFAFS